MSQRIQEIVIQTDEFFKKEGRSFFRHQWNEKFAQLVIQECVDLCIEWDGGENMFSRGLSEHFGV